MKISAFIYCISTQDSFGLFFGVYYYESVWVATCSATTCVEVEGGVENGQVREDLKGTSRVNPSPYLFDRFLAYATTKLCGSQHALLLHVCVTCRGRRRRRRRPSRGRSPGAYSALAPRAPSIYSGHLLLRICVTTTLCASPCLGRRQRRRRPNRGRAPGAYHWRP